jgi:hypothetical protein
MAIRSSKDAAATTRAGMPLSTPHPRFWRSNMSWMMMAGPTAFRINPSARASIQGIPKTAWATDPEIRASAMPGMRRRRVAAGPARRKVRQSSSRPERRKIRASAPCLILPRQGMGRARTSQGTGMF